MGMFDDIGTRREAREAPLEMRDGRPVVVVRGTAADEVPPPPETPQGGGMFNDIQPQTKSGERFEIGGWAPAASGIGALAGAADIGNTLVTGGVKAATALASPMATYNRLVGNTSGKGLSGLITGEPDPNISTVTGLPKNPAERWDEERRASLAQFNKEQSASNPISYGGARIGANIAGTLGAGGLLAAPLRGVPMLAPLAQSLATAGTRTGLAPASVLGRTANLGLRSAGGAGAGYGGSVLVDPESGGTGAAFGAAVPLAGPVLNAAGRVWRGPEINPLTRAAAQVARDAGYVIPPTQVRPSLINRLGEGYAGKLTTAQNASAMNQQVTDRLAREAIGATDLTPGAIQAVRSRANQQYTNLGNFGRVTTDAAYQRELADIGARSQQFAADFPELTRGQIDELVNTYSQKIGFDAQSGIEAIKRLRADARANGRAFMDPDRLALGRAQGELAGAVENLVERNLQRTGRTGLLERYRDARRTLAQTHEIENALNETTGSVDARKLASALDKGAPLTGNLRTIAQTGQAFKTATKMPENMGSLPQLSPLDWIAATGGSVGTGNVLPMLHLAARPATRAAILSGPVQNRLLAGAPRAGGPPSMVRRQLQRAAPVLGSGLLGIEDRDNALLNY
jgi:hypothetical protein